jgi:hypothetical protein
MLDLTLFPRNKTEGILYSTDWTPWKLMPLKAYILPLLYFVIPKISYSWGSFPFPFQPLAYAAIVYCGWDYIPLTCIYATSAHRPHMQQKEVRQTVYEVWGLNHKWIIDQKSFFRQLIKYQLHNASEYLWGIHPMTFENTQLCKFNCNI